MVSHFKMISLLVMCSTFFLISACAFGTRNVTLVYPPEKASQESGPKSAEASTSSPSIGKSIILLQFTDQRVDKRVIGEVRNGWGMRTADVVAENDVSEWITQALRMEMEKAGHKVTISKNNIISSIEPNVGGEIITVYCIALFSYEGEVSFFANIQKDGKELLKKRYSGKGSAGLNWAATASGYGESLSMALSVAAKSLVDDINELVKTNKL